MDTQASPRVSFVPVVALALAACQSPHAAPSTAPSPATAATQDGGAAAKKGFEKVGVFAPIGAAAISFWPEAYNGSWVVLDVRPNGSKIETGDVVAQIDARAIDEEIHRAELELKSKDLALAQQRKRNDLDEEAAQRAARNAAAALDRARRQLEGYTSKELAFSKRQDELSKRYEQANLEDQRDELDQLEKMYKADDLVDATEDIVIKRSRRSLETTKTSNDLSRDRARYREELDQALQVETRTEDVANRTAELARLTATQAIERESRVDAEARAADAAKEARTKVERLRRDRELFEIKSPRAGVLLHGSTRDWRPGRAPSRWERGSTLQPRTELFLVAEPEPSAVSVDVTDSEAARLAATPRLHVAPVSAPDSVARGEIAIEPYARNLAVGDATYEALVRLAEPVHGALYGQRAKVTAPEEAR